MSKKETSPSQIRDIPSYSRLVKDAEGIDSLGKVWPLMKRLGLVQGDLPRGQEGIADLRRRGEELINLPDRFNAALASRGWIAYESLNVDLMRRAVDLAQGGKIEQAESEILAYYKSEDTVRWHLKTMLAVRAWQPREDLANLAMADYLAGRYHATVPVVLSLMDGLVSDLAVTGFFAEGTEMTAWDSVAAHSSGLKALCDLFNKGRRKTTSEPIWLPYRHGILHGRDLGYANEVVAGKAWAALFAVREWALKVEGGTSAPPKDPEKAEGQQGLLASLERLRTEKSALERWTPREEKKGAVPRNEVEDGSPEEKALEVLGLWSQGNYGGLAGCLSALSGEESVAKRAGRIRKNLEPKQIVSFEIMAVADDTAAISVVTARVQGKASFAIEVEYYFFELRVIYENDRGEILLRGQPEGHWKIIEASLYYPKKETGLFSHSSVIRLHIEGP